ncbi:MAG TPA: Hsp20/alpha crystallin family protein [Casimicrobiaceae bacterium]|nr:Hsp20/alpha crystallin family protein [Casimicrobiaceae bacterium]
MANENPSRENPARQQSAERAQTGTSQQGTGAQQGTSQGGSHGTGGYGQGTGQGTQGRTGYAPGSSGQNRNSERGYEQGQGRYGQQGTGRGNYGQGVGTSTWQGGRQSGGPLSTRGGSSMSPYAGASGYGSGPFSVMRRISDEMDRLFENFGMGRGLFQGEPEQGRAWDAGGYGAGAPSMWSPHIEVCERSGKLLIQADLPGMKRDDVHVRIEDDEVIIQGERRQEQAQDESGYYRSERSYGSFYRTIPLPEGTNAESASATFKDGVLEIEIDAPRPQQRGRTLEIRDAGASQSGGRSGTGSGTTYGSGTSGAMEGTSGTSGGQHPQSGASASQHATAGTSGTQHSASGTSGTQQSSGSGTMYSGSGNPSVGAAGMGGSQASSSDKSSRGSST